MTPFAQSIIKYYLSVKNDEIVRRFAIARMFEFSDVLPEIGKLSEDIDKLGVEGIVDAIRDYFFLPSPQCWFEYHHPSGARYGVQLEHDETNPEDIVIVPFFRDDEKMADPRYRLGNDYIGLPFIIGIEGNRLSVECRKPDDTEGDNWRAITKIAMTVVSCLVMINMPNFVDLEAKPSHKGMIKRLAHDTKAKPEIEWHTVTIRRQHGDATEGDHPGGGGQKRLHFVRAHLRILQSKKVTRVRSHWRGHKELGTLMTDYRLPSGT